MKATTRDYPLTVIPILEMTCPFRFIGVHRGFPGKVEW